MKFLLFTLLLAASAAGGALFMTTTNNWLTEEEQQQLRMEGWNTGAAYMDEAWIGLVQETANTYDEPLGFALRILQAMEFEQNAINSGTAIYQDGKQLSPESAKQIIEAVLAQQ